MVSKNPAERSCFDGCPSCSRCTRRAHNGCPLPNTCSGRPDAQCKREPHPDDLCQCATGVMRWVTKNGRVIVRRFKSDPFAGTVKTDTANADERDWLSYLQEQRELMNDEHFDPIVFTDGTSTDAWMQGQRRGK